VPPLETDCTARVGVISDGGARAYSRLPISLDYDAHDEQLLTGREALLSLLGQGRLHQGLGGGGLVRLGLCALIFNHFRLLSRVVTGYCSLHEFCNGPAPIFGAGRLAGEQVASA
jgi:hypothetical protein